MLRMRKLGMYRFLKYISHGKSVWFLLMCVWPGFWKLVLNAEVKIMECKTMVKFVSRIKLMID